MRPLRYWPVAVLMLAVSAQITFAAEEDLVISRRGDLPILLTAPHGGTLAVPGARKRVHGKLTRDAGTLELALALVDRITKQAGGAPYLVAARFHREYIDANRSEAGQGSEERFGRGKRRRFAVAGRIQGMQGRKG